MRIPIEFYKKQKTKKQQQQQQQKQSTIGVVIFCYPEIEKSKH